MPAVMPPGITEGGIFVVKGSNLSASGYDLSGFPLLTTYNNAGITLTPTLGRDPHERVHALHLQSERREPACRGAAFHPGPREL